MASIPALFAALTTSNGCLSPPSECSRRSRWSNVWRGTNQDRLILRKTSGSSGQPFVFARSLIEERFLGWVRLRAMLEMGTRLTYRHASVLINHKRQKSDKQLPLGILKAFGLMRGAPIDCFQEPRAILDQLVRVDPDVIIGFPGVLSRVATLAQAPASRLSSRA